VSKHKPRVSIGLPVYNGERFLSEALDSLLAQTYQNFELIISDNASTDATESICRAYAASDQRIRYYRNEENLGAARNFNRVFKLSTGELFKWAAADDICMPTLLARCLEVLDCNADAVLACTKTGFVDEFGKSLALQDPGWNLQMELPHERLREIIYTGRLVNPYYGLTRSHSLSKTRLLGSYPGGDYRLLGELSLVGKFIEIPDCLFLRRIHTGASSRNSGDVEWQVMFYTGRKGYSMKGLHRYFDHFITILFSQLSIRQKFSLLGSLLRVLNWSKQQISQELILALKNLLATKPFCPPR
jgi:glycosyltransferase involved in cell wall biosynthesis